MSPITERPAGMVEIFKTVDYGTLANRLFYTAA